MTHSPTQPELLAVELEALVEKAFSPNARDWYVPWRVVPSDGKPIIAGSHSGNLFRGFIGTWQDADLVVALVNNLPTILSALRPATGNGDARTGGEAMRAKVQRWRDNLAITQGDPVPGDALHGPALDFVIEQLDGFLASEPAPAGETLGPQQRPLNEAFDGFQMLRDRFGNKPSSMSDAEWHEATASADEEPAPAVDTLLDDDEAWAKAVGTVPKSDGPLKLCPRTLEAAAIDWLARKFDVPEDQDFSPDEMVDAFIEGYALATNPNPNPNASVSGDGK